MTATTRKCLVWAPAVLTLTCLAVYGLVFAHYRLRADPAVSTAAADQAVRYLRAALNAEAAPELAAEVAAKDPPGPVWITLFSNGSPLFRHRADEGTLRKRLDAARGAMMRSEAVQRLTPAQRQAVRIKMDLLTGRGPVATSIPFLFAKSIVPGLDGVGLTVEGETAYLLPDDLFRLELMSGYHPFFFMKEFRAGMDLKRVLDLLADDLALSAEKWRASSRTIFRFRVQSFVESLENQRALAVSRSRVPVHRIRRKTVKDAVLRAADYVLRQIRHDGSFHYIYYPLNNGHSPPGRYSLPRHAGTTWFLSLATHVLQKDRFKKGARRAIEYLVAHAVPPECQRTPYACVGKSRHADLGSAALAVVAIAEYEKATGDQRYRKLAQRLGEFLIWMQKPNGDFCHQFTPRSGEKNCEDILLYYTGEAAFALAKLFQLTRDKTYVAPLEKALDFLTDEKYDFFLGQFFISEDHWTCIAAEAAYEAVNKRQYAEFCYEFAHLNGRTQVRHDEGLMSDLHGAFLITPFFMPHNTPAGSRTEANVATYLLSQKRQETDPEILRIIRSSVRFLVDQQIRPEATYLFANPEAASGGMMQTPIRPNIRIDFVQHAAAAMARALPLIPETSWEK